MEGGQVGVGWEGQPEDGGEGECRVLSPTMATGVRISGGRLASGWSRTKPPTTQGRWVGDHGPLASDGFCFPQKVGSRVVGRVFGVSRGTLEEKIGKSSVAMGRGYGPG